METRRAKRLKSAGPNLDPDVPPCEACLEKDQIIQNIDQESKKKDQVIQNLQR